MGVTKQFHKKFGTLPFGKGHICWIQILLKINQMKIDVESIENLFVIMVSKERENLERHELAKIHFNSFLLGNCLKLILFWNYLPK